MASCNSYCCLCTSAFNTISSRKKRKLLYGFAASQELPILRSILTSILALTNSPVVTGADPLSAIPQLGNKKTCLCVQCHDDLKKCNDLKQDLDQTVASICSNIYNIPGLQTTGIMYSLVQSPH